MHYLDVTDHDRLEEVLYLSLSEVERELETELRAPPGSLASWVEAG